ncbi:o-acetylhomoserine o-acetylserine sulfhydrylase [Colletotrichum kahawae]|uniref:O-acetylhomoserine o-acetylserine sulfhydrylase n=1 Tax=Colletotrichum kahawae TaxID=34407 RepID=A0AAD9YJ39_COLKA|nr:o-acetylhomoserine o-acetylserine sulfhydrylase [Colletotrichum kahawae]
MGILRPAAPFPIITTASSAGSNAVRERSYYAQANRWPAPRPAEAQTHDDLPSDSIICSPPPFVVIRVSRPSPVAGESLGAGVISGKEGQERDEGSRQKERLAATGTPTTTPTTMAERRPYDGGGIVPPHIRTAIAEHKNASASAAPAKMHETNPAAKEIRAEEYTRSGFVPAYVLKNMATSEASTPEQRADAQGTLDSDKARRERGKDRDAEGQGKK